MRVIGFSAGAAGREGNVDHMLGDAAKEVKVTQEMFARWEDDCGAATAVEAAAEKLKNI